MTRPVLGVEPAGGHWPLDSSVLLRSDIVMATDIRLLQPGDETALESFLSARLATSMFLRSNLRMAGIVDEGKRYQGSYVGVLDGKVITGVVGHLWSGNLLLQLPHCEREAIELAVELSGRPIAGLVGPWEQVEAVRHGMGLGDRATTLDSCEDLFALAYEDLVIPSGLADGTLVCRAPREDEHARLTQWTLDYSVEALKMEPSEALERTCRESVEAQISNDTLYVLLDNGIAVSKTGFNATLPDCVQIGGVYTPPELRSRGYGRTAVAGSLIDVASRGVQMSILFTAKENLSAQGAYRRLGYRVIGEYGLVRFESPVRRGH